MKNFQLVSVKKKIAIPARFNMYSVFPIKGQDHLSAKMFLDEAGGVNVARYEKVKYPVFSGFTKKQKGIFWQPEEVDISKDGPQFRSMTPFEQHISISNVLRQSTLDSVQGRAPMLAFAPICSLPELEAWFTWWTAIEQIHSESYTHISRQVFHDPTKVFNTLLEIEPIVDCAKSISKYYDDLIRLNNIWALKEEFPELPYDEYEHKKAIWLALMAVNALEGIRFYVSFACSWAFAETKRLVGIATIIKLICRDENLHLGSTQQLLKMLPKDDPIYARIREETVEECRQIFVTAAEQEIAWASYLFKDGSILGLNEEILVKYVKWITTKRMKALKYDSPYDVGSTNPLAWTEKWIAGAEYQPAPQELEITSYTSGDVKKDVTDDFLSTLSL